MSVAACIMMVPALMVPDNRASPYVEDAGLVGLRHVHHDYLLARLPGRERATSLRQSLETMTPVIPTGK